MTSLTMSIGWPDMDPDESTEKVSDRGRRPNSWVDGATTATIIV